MQTRTVKTSEYLLTPRNVNITCNNQSTESWFGATPLFCLISVRHHLELHIAITFADIIVFYQLGYTIYFSVHIYYLYLTILSNKKIKIK